MRDKITEQEQKELNKKLLKKTFVSEIKNPQKEKFSKLIIDFVCLFIAFFVSDLIIEKLQIDFWLLDIAITIMLTMIMLFISEILTKKLNSKL